MYPRNYILYRSKCHYDLYDDLDTPQSDPYEVREVRAWDQKLHQALCKIFRERCRTSGQIKQLLRGPVKRNDKKSIFKQILRQEPAFGELFQKSNNTLSLLWIAIMSCYQASAELLVSSGADVNELYTFDSHPLRRKSSFLHALLKMYPSSWNERFIRLVIDHGADLRARDINADTLLHCAVKYGRVEVAEMLLEKGADVNAVNLSQRCTPLLDGVVEYEAGELVPLLIKHGADVTVRDKAGKNVLYYLAESTRNGDNVDVARVLIENGASPREVMGSNQHQPIHAAVIRGKNGLVNLFLDHGANVNAPAIFHKFPLYLAARQYDSEPAVLLTLLKRGANVDLKNGDGETALHALARSPDVINSAKKMKLLLSVGADIFAKAYNNKGTSPLDIGSYYFNNKNDPRILAPMLKALALRKACLPPTIKFKDEIIVKEKYPGLWNRYQYCVDEIARIESTKFIKTGTFYELLTKCQCQIVNTLMRNLEFKSQFRLYDFSDFPVYEEDLREAFERAEHYYQSVLEKEALIDEAVYDGLPHRITRQVARYMLGCEICEMKKTVSASRQIIAIE